MDSSAPEFEEEEGAYPPAGPSGAAPPSGPVRPVAAVRARPAPNWGSVGTTWPQPLGDGSGASGVLRRVEGGVDYQPPPLERTWYRSRRAQHFEMPWPGDPLRARTFARLGEELREAKRSGSLSPNDPRLDELDRVADRLLDLVERLHRAGWLVGLLHPDNLVLAEEGGHAEPVPVDLGFWFVDPRELAPPTWLTANPDAALWADDDAELRQRAHACRDALPPAGDVKLLGRLLACVLTGRPEREIKPASRAPVWQTLAEAVQGTYATPAELRQALRGTPLSAEFRPARTPPPRARRWPWVVLALVLAAGLGAALLSPPLNFLWRPSPFGADAGRRDGPTRPGGKESPADLAGLLRQFEAAPPETQAELVRRMAASPLDPDDPKDESRQQALARARGRYLDGWIGRYRAAEAGASDPGARFEVADRLQALRDELAGLVGELPPAPGVLQERESHPDASQPP
jgi:hypothetical protein